MRKESDNFAEIRRIVSIFSKAWFALFLISVFLLSKVYKDNNPFEVFTGVNVSKFILAGVCFSLLYIIPILMSSWVKFSELMHEYGVTDYKKVILIIQKVLGMSIGLAGLIFFIIFFLINSDAKSNLEVIMLLSLTVYSFLQAILILYSRYALVSSIILISVVVLPQPFLQHDLFDNQAQQNLINWLPIILLLILPSIQKNLSNMLKLIHIRHSS